MSKTAYLLPIIMAMCGLRLWILVAVANGGVLTLGDNGNVFTFTQAELASFSAVQGGNGDDSLTILLTEGAGDLVSLDIANLDISGVETLTLRSANKGISFTDGDIGAYMAKGVKSLVLETMAFDYIGDSVSVAKAYVGGVESYYFTDSGGSVYVSLLAEIGITGTAGIDSFMVSESGIAIAGGAGRDVVHFAGDGAFTLEGLTGIEELVLAGDSGIIMLDEASLRGAVDVGGTAFSISGAGGNLVMFSESGWLTSDSGATYVRNGFTVSVASDLSVINGGVFTGGAEADSLVISADLLGASSASDRLHTFTAGGGDDSLTILYSALPSSFDLLPTTSNLETLTLRVQDGELTLSQADLQVIAGRADRLEIDADSIAYSFASAGAVSFSQSVTMVGGEKLVQYTHAGASFYTSAGTAVSITGNGEANEFMLVENLFGLSIDGGGGTDILVFNGGVLSLSDLSLSSVESLRLVGTSVASITESALRSAVGAGVMSFSISGDSASAVLFAESGWELVSGDYVRNGFTVSVSGAGVESFDVLDSVTYAFFDGDTLGAGSYVQAGDFNGDSVVDLLVGSAEGLYMLFRDDSGVDIGLGDDNYHVLSLAGIAGLSGFICWRL